MSAGEPRWRHQAPIPPFPIEGEGILLSPPHKICAEQYWPSPARGEESDYMPAVQWKGQATGLDVDIGTWG
jgi:hypothetical protein